MKLRPELIGVKVEVVKDYPVYYGDKIVVIWKKGEEGIITGIEIGYNSPSSLFIESSGVKCEISQIQFEKHFIVLKDIEKPTFKPTTFEEGLKANPRLFQCLGAFACDMQNRLDVKAGEKGGWSNWRKNCTQEYLYRKANEHFNEINRPGRLYSEVIKECADTANYLMMIADNIRTKE